MSAAIVCSRPVRSDRPRGVRLRALMLAGLLPLALGACASSSPAAPGASTGVPAECRTPDWRERLTSLFSPAPGVMPVTADSVRYLNAGLERAAIVRTLAARRSAEGVAVEVHFLNCTDQRIALAARTTFLDAAQRPQGQPSAWQLLHLQPRSTSVYSERTLGDAAVNHFFVEVRDVGGRQ